MPLFWKCLVMLSLPPFFQGSQDGSPFPNSPENNTVRKVKAETNQKVAECGFETEHPRF